MEARKQFSRIGWAFVVFCLVDVLVQVIMGVAIGLWNRQENSGMPNLDIMLLGQVSMYVFAFPVFWLMMKRIPSWRKRDEGQISAGQLFLWAVVCFGFTYIGNYIGQLLMGGVEAFTGNPQENPVLDMLNDMNPWMVFLTTVIIAPVMEELMFRKLLIDRIVPFGQRVAVVVSGLAFGLFHGNFYQFFYAFSLGAVFAYIYSSTGRVRYGIMLHMMTNLMGGVFPGDERIFHGDGLFHGWNDLSGALDVRKHNRSRCFGLCLFSEADMVSRMGACSGKGDLPCDSHGAGGDWVFGSVCAYVCAVLKTPVMNVAESLDTPI